MALSKVIIRVGTRCERANYPTASEPGTQLVFTTHIVEELEPCYLFAFSMEKKMSQRQLLQDFGRDVILKYLFWASKPIMALLLEKSNMHTHINTHRHATFVHQPLSFPPAHGDNKMLFTKFSHIHDELLSVFTTDGPWGFLQDDAGFYSKTFAFWLWFQRFSISWPWTKISTKCPLHKPGL